MPAVFDPSKPFETVVDREFAAFTAPKTPVSNSGSYGNRASGSPKGMGYFGELKRPDGQISTELSIGVEFDGKEQEIPSLVPTLTKPEIDHLLRGGEPTEAILEKAVTHARNRLAQGKDPFAQPGEQSKPTTPKFDPNQPFQTISETKPQLISAGGAKQFNPSEEFEKVFSLEEIKSKSEAELNEDKGFRPVEFGLQNQAALQKDPEALEKLVRIYQSRETRGTALAEKGAALIKGTPKVAKVLGTGLETAARLGREISGAPFRILGAATVRGGVEGEIKELAGKAAEVPASIEAAEAGVGELLRRSGREVKEGAAGLVGGGKAAMTPQEWRSRFFMDVSGLEQSQKAGQGNGAVLQALGNDAETLKGAGIELNPETIQELSVVTDPINWIPVGGAVGAVTKVGGRLTTRIVATTLNAEQAAKLAAGLNSAREAASLGTGAAGKATQVVGRGVEKVGQAAQRAVEGISGRTATGVGLGALIGTGDITTALGVGVAARGIPKALSATGRAIQAGGEVLTGARPVPAAAQIAGQGVRGVGEGLLLSLPFAIGARPEEEEAILGAAGLAGAARAGITAAPKVVGAVGGKAQNVLAETIFRRAQQAEAPQSPAYGVEPAFDSSHAATVAKLDPQSQKLINWTRELFRDSGVEVYAVDNKTFQGQTGTSNAYGYAVNIGQRLAPDGTVSPVLRVFLNGEAEALPHELFHALSDLDPPGAKAISDSVMQSWTPEQKETFADIYNTARNDGRPKSAWTTRLTDEAVANEAGAEVFSRLYLGQDLSGVNPNVRQKAALFLSGVLEKFGAPLGKVGAEKGLPGVSTLGVRPGVRSTRIGQEWIQNLLQRVRERGNILPETPITSLLEGGTLEVPETRRGNIQQPTALAPSAPAAPTTPAPTVPVAAPPTARPPLPKVVPAAPARNIRVTRQQQNDFAARRAEDLGIERAKAAAKDPEVQQRVNELSTLMESGNPVLEIDHRGVIAEGTAEAPSGRTTRRAEQEAAYIQEGLGAAPESVRDRHQKTFVPVRWEIIGGKPQLLAMSLDKVIANISRAVKDIVAAKQEAKLPYEVTAGKLTDAGWELVVQDLQSYTENQSNGYRGDGQKLVRPGEDVQQSLPVENPGYNPTLLPEDKTNFLNLIQGLAPPLTAREVQGRVPGTIKGAVIARAQGREPQVPSVIRLKDLAKQTFPSGERILETNPLRNELAAAGVPVRELIEVTERINAGDILNVTPRTDLQFKAPVTDIIRGGFLPKNETVKRTPSDEIRKLANSYSRTEGIEYRPTQDYVEVNSGLAKRLADFYEETPHNPGDPAVQASYQALADETLKQYRAMESAGYTIEPFEGQGEPYKSSAEAIADIRNNKHLYFLKTEGAFTGAGDNPLLRDSGIPGLTVNDVFRAVHDFFGHAKEGYSFGPRGEFNAWRSHSEMYSPTAQGALAAETLAQNSWVNFGKHLRDKSGNVPQKGQPGYKELTQRPFAEQKSLVVPNELISEAKQATPGQFLPSNKENFDGYVNQVAGADANQFRELSKKWGGGFTTEAWKVGREVTSPEQVATLKRLQTEQETAGRAALSSGDFDTATPAAFKSQFFREAWEAATGEGSAGNALRQRDPNYKPPFPAVEMEGEFLPRTAKGTELSKEGFDFRISGQKGARGVTVLKNGISIGEIVSKQISPAEAEISLARLSQSERGRGVGEAAYRELLTQLKEDGVTEVGGTIVAPEPLAIRRKIFGDKFKKLELNVEPVSIDEALAAANRIRQGTRELTNIEAVNEITPEMQFLPAERFPKKQDPIDYAAVKIQGGPTGIGSWHVGALGDLESQVFRNEKWAKYRPIFEDEDSRAKAFNSGQLVDGYRTISGKFLSRQEALDHAKKIGQISPESESAQTRTGLEAVSFEEERQFLPKSKRDRELERQAREKSTQRQAEVATTDYSKYGLARLETQREIPEVGKTGNTGWVFPDKSFVPLEQSFHEQYLAENADTLNKKFGTKFSKTPDVEERLSALNAGFSRFRYDAGKGGVHVEVNNKFWPKQRAAILDQLLSDPESIDSVTLSLLNDKGQVVESRSSKGLFELEGVERAGGIQDFIDEFRGGKQAGEFLPSETKRISIEDAKVRDSNSNQFYYHTTLPDHIVSISEEGLKPSEETNWGGLLGSTSIGKVFAAETPKKSLYYGEILTRPAREHNPNSFVPLLRFSRTKDFTPESSDPGSVVSEKPVRGPFEVWTGKRWTPLTKDIAEGIFYGDWDDEPFRFLPKEREQTFKGFEPISAEQRAKAITQRKVARTRESNPEAILPRYSRDEEGNMVLTPEGRPKPIAQEYDLVNTPLAREAAKGLRGPERESAIAKALGKELITAYKSAEKNPEIAAGSKWYSTARGRLKKLFGDDSKFFAELLGATSARTPVETNFRFALDAYNRFKQGEYNDILAKYREGKQAFDAGEIQDYVKATKNEDPTRGQFLDWWVEKHDLIPTQSTGKKFAANSRAVLRVLDGSWQSEVKGPKTPNFAGNLTGQTFEATVDVWAARALHRLANLGNEKRWRILPENETGVTDADFYLGQATYRAAAEKLGIKPDALQAVLWFAEKKHWEDRGWTRGAGAKRSDFNVLLAETEKSPEGIFRKKQPQKELEFFTKKGESKE